MENLLCKGVGHIKQICIVRSVHITRMRFVSVAGKTILINFNQTHIFIGFYC